jgi:hypothetical protein
MRTFTALLLAGVIALAACSPTGAPAPSGVPAQPSSEPSATVESASPAPSPSDAAAAASPSAASVVATTDELQLLSRVRLDLQSRCTPLRTDLADKAVAAVECAPASDVVGHATLYLFDTQKDLLGTYEARLATNDVPMRTNGGRCEAGRASEGGYVPGDGHEGVVVVERGGCYLDAGGNAHYAATVPPFVLIEVEGKVGDVEAVERWAWLGNQDQPGGPTVWRDNGPVSPEK